MFRERREQIDRDNEKERERTNKRINNLDNWFIHFANKSNPIENNGNATQKCFFFLNERAKKKKMK